MTNSYRIGYKRANALHTPVEVIKIGFTEGRRDSREYFYSGASFSNKLAQSEKERNMV